MGSTLGRFFCVGLLTSVLLSCTEQDPLGPTFSRTLAGDWRMTRTRVVTGGVDVTVSASDSTMQMSMRLDESNRYLLTSTGSSMELLPVRSEFSVDSGGYVVAGQSIEFMSFSGDVQQMELEFIRDTLQLKRADTVNFRPVKTVTAFVRSDSPVKTFETRVIGYSDLARNHLRGSVRTARTLSEGPNSIGGTDTREWVEEYSPEGNLVRTKYSGMAFEEWVSRYVNIELKENIHISVWSGT